LFQGPKKKVRGGREEIRRHCGIGKRGALNSTIKEDHQGGQGLAGGIKRKGPVQLGTGKAGLEKNSNRVSLREG